MFLYDNINTLRRVQDGVRVASPPLPKRNFHDRKDTGLRETKPKMDVGVSEPSRKHLLFFQSNWTLLLGFYQPIVSRCVINLYRFVCMLCKFWGEITSEHRLCGTFLTNKKSKQKRRMKTLANATRRIDFYILIKFTIEKNGILQ